jgi:putative membrane protein
LFDRLKQRWIGVVLTLVACVATVWLWATGDLGLYVHPRYFVFTVVAAGVGLVVVVASFVVSVPQDEGDDEFDGSRRSSWRAVLSITVVAACLLGVGSLLVLPPATLTSATADQRSVNSGTVVGSGASAATGDTADYGIKEWATALRQSTDLQSLAGSPASLTGFVSEDPDDPENVFYVTRFFVTCCAADAQPVGVPVYQPGPSTSTRASRAASRWC